MTPTTAVGTLAPEAHDVVPRTHAIRPEGADVWAQEAARSSGAHSLQPCHLVQAIFDHFPGESDRACAALGTTREQIVAQARSLMRVGRSAQRRGDLPPSREAKRVIEDSADVARQEGSEYVGVGHLLCGCLLYIGTELSPEWSTAVSSEARCRATCKVVVSAFGAVPFETEEQDTSTPHQTTEARQPANGAAAPRLSEAITSAVMRLLDSSLADLAQMDAQARRKLTGDLRNAIAGELVRFI